MTQIKIEVPSNDPIALSALGEALQRIATERGYERSLTREEIGNSSHKDDTFVHDLDVNNMYLNRAPNVKPDNTTNVELKDDVTKREGDLVTSSDVKLCETASDFVNACAGDLTEQVDASIVLSTDTETVGDVKVPDSLPTDDTLDKDGLPWDKRIHSRGKTRLADDTWRLARKPNDKTQEEWDEYVASVKAELKAVQDIPAPSLTEEQVREEIKEKLESGEAVVQAPTEALVTPPVVETETVTPPTLDEQAVADVQASEPVAAVEPPASVTAPVVTDNTPSVSTFQELMKYITSDAAKRGATNDMIKEVLAQVDPSLTAIPLIANRADLIPSFVAKLEGRLS